MPDRAGSRRCIPHGGSRSFVSKKSHTTRCTPGRPGPVNLDVPYNVYQEEDDVEVPPASHTMGSHRPGASEADLAAALARAPFA